VGSRPTSRRFTLGPIIRWGRNRNIRNKYDKEPEWRHKSATLDTGYTPRHYAKRGA